MCKSDPLRVGGTDSRFKDLQASQNMELKTEQLGLLPSQKVRLVK